HRPLPASANSPLYTSSTTLVTVCLRRSVETTSPIRATPRPSLKTNEYRPRTVVWCVIASSMTPCFSEPLEGVYLKMRTSSAGYGSGVTTGRAKSDARVGIAANAVPTRAPVTAPIADHRMVRFAERLLGARKDEGPKFGRLVSPILIFWRQQTYLASTAVRFS